MPELPEVESIVVGLRARLLGQRLTDIQVRWPGAVDAPTSEALAPEALVQRLRGKVLAAVERRAKYILFSFPPWALLVHLRMTGRLLLCAVPDADLEQNKHMHVRFAFDRDLLYYCDPRKFGRLYLVADAAERLAMLGPEPLAPEFTSELLAERLRAHRRQLKPLLLDQRFVAGLGNIYVDESLWLARLHPTRRSHTLTAPEVRALHAALRSVLARAVERKGTTLRDYRGANNEPGEFGAQLVVYGHAGDPCPRCGQPVVRIVVGNRGTHLCPLCQDNDGESHLTAHQER